MNETLLRAGLDQMTQYMGKRKCWAKEDPSFHSHLNNPLSVMASCGGFCYPLHCHGLVIHSAPRQRSLLTHVQRAGGSSVLPLDAYDLAPRFIRSPQKPGCVLHSELLQEAMSHGFLGQYYHDCAIYYTYDEWAKLCLIYEFNFNHRYMLCN